MSEILSPAGDMKCLVAAVQGGCDAVYIGGKDFSARKSAGNFSRDEIISAVRYCHLRHVKVYVTVNTMLLQGELKRAADFCCFLESAGADAVITADTGLASLVLENTGLPVHASTQMCVHNATGAKLLKKAGFTRVVLARELSLDEIKAVSDTGIETEVFVHGALCSSVSGLCLMSSFIGQRSGNRGECAQPCRLPYTCSGSEKYFLSTADLCAADIMKELLDAGVRSFKIEGRLKPPEYVYGVSSVYSRALSDAECGRKGEYLSDLENYYNRTFTDGYYFGRTDVCAPDRPDNRNRTDCTFTERDDKYYSLKGIISLETGKKPGLEIECNGIKVTSEGNQTLEKAQKELPEDTVIRSLMKTGGTPFEFSHIEVKPKGNPFVSKSVLNAMRRDAIEKLEREILKPKDVPARDIKVDLREINHELKSIYVQTSDENIAMNAIASGADRIYYSPVSYSRSECESIKRIACETGVRPFVSLVPFLRDDDMKYVSDLLESYADYTAGVLCGNFSQIKLKKISGQAVLDYTANTANSESAAFAASLGFDSVTLSSEMSKRDIRQMKSMIPVEIVCFGYLPLMWFAHDVPSRLRDRKGYGYIIRSYGLPHSLHALDNPVKLCVREISSVFGDTDALRLIINSREDIRAIKYYLSAVSEKRDVEAFESNATQGHLKRGV